MTTGARIRLILARAAKAVETVDRSSIAKSGLNPTDFSILEAKSESRSEIERGIVDGSLDMAVMLGSNLENKEDIDSEVLIRSRRRLWLCA